MSGQAQTERRKVAVIKAVVLALFVITAVYVTRFTPVRNFLTRETLIHFFEDAGVWAPLAYVLFYAVGVCLFIPGGLLTVLGAVIFGPYYGFLYVWAGAMAGATAAFWIGRTLGREFAATLIGDRLKKYDDSIERKGFATVLYLRLAYFPFTPMNFGMGLTRVRFWDYFWGTGIGIIVGTFILTFFFGTLKSIWSRGDWSELFSVRVFFSVGLFIFSLFIPKVIGKFAPSRSSSSKSNQRTTT
jgi:uncharacterized membrane protein YdjX (TVP38/TMEM64 family)